MKRPLITTLVIVAFAVLLITSVSAAVTCTPTSVSSSIVSGQTASSQTLTCSNSVNSTVSIFKSGTHFNSNPTIPTTIGALESNKQFTISFNSNSGIGNHTGFIYFSDGSTTIPVTLSVSSPQQTGCQINPSLVSYTQSVQQGTQLPLPKITFEPVNCNGQLILTSSNVFMQGGIITTDGQRPVYISSVVSDGILLSIDTLGLTTQQTYTSYLTISSFSKQFQIPFVITVTSGTSPVNNFSSSNLPTCSVTSTTLNLNSTYSLVCTNLQPNIDITPIVDEKYISGVNLDTASNQWVWSFKAIEFGDTEIKAKFSTRGAPIGNLYSQKVKISSSGLGLPGTNLKLVFTPKLDQAKSGDTIIVQLVDNQTNSLVANPELLIDAIPYSLNNTGFYVKMEGQKDYEFRARSSGYSDLVQTVRITTQPMNLTISPESGDTITQFTISSTATNTTILIDGAKVGETPYTGTLSIGNHEIVGVKDGYEDAKMNITVSESLTATLSTTFEKGVATTITLSKNSTWQILYAKSEGKNESVLLTGQGSIINYTPNKKGMYKLVADGKTLGIYPIQGKSWSFMNISVWWWGAGLALIGFLWYIFRKDSESKSEPNLFAGMK